MKSRHQKLALCSSRGTIEVRIVPSPAGMAFEARLGMRTGAISDTRESAIQSLLRRLAHDSMQGAFL